MRKHQRAQFSGTKLKKFLVPLGKEERLQVLIWVARECGRRALKRRLSQPDSEKG